MHYSCPKCPFVDKDETVMTQHLETELAKIRWGCNLCVNHFQTYHQAQFHCKSHQGQSARPVEVLRDPNGRAAWVSAVIQSQKLFINIPTNNPTVDNDYILGNSEDSLLVVRYEERVPTPEEALRRKLSTSECNDDRLLLERDKSKGSNEKYTCQYCDFTTKYPKTLKVHLYRHYDLKPYKCPVCPATGHRGTIVNHITSYHPKCELSCEYLPLPEGPPKYYTLQKRNPKQQAPEVPSTHICLNCEQFVPETEMGTHKHDNEPAEFAKRGEIVVKCCICLALRLDVKSLQDHHNTSHPNIPINYSFFKMHCQSRDIHQCGYCMSRFMYLRDLKTHHNAMHSSLQLKYTNVSSATASTSQNDANKRKTDDDSILPMIKRIAKKSTTKLPAANKTVAKKSTTKLPSMSEESDDEYSYYGSKPAPLESHDVTALMPFCGTVMRVTMDKLTEIIPIDPKVVVDDISSDKSVSKD